MKTSANAIGHWPIVRSVFTVVSILSVLLVSAQAHQTHVASLSSGGALGVGFSGEPSISADGRYVAFASTAANLVASDTNGAYDIFVRDRWNGTTVLVSQSSAGVQGNGASQFPSISPEGRYVAFESIATNLVSGDTNGASDIFVRDLQNNTTQRVSVFGSGIQADGDSRFPSISANGGHVAFESLATNLVLGDSNGTTDIFVRSLGTSTTERVSVNSSGAQANGFSAHADISPSGRYVAFDSFATNLIASDTNIAHDVFVHDRVLNTTERVSVSDNFGSQGNGDSEFPSISDDGRYVAFESIATNLVFGDSNGLRDTFVVDRQTTATVRLSVSSGGTQGNGISQSPSISADGLHVAFVSAATNLVSGDANVHDDVFVRDWMIPAIERVSSSSAGVEPNGNSFGVSFSGEGASIAFGSIASNLIDGVSTSPETETFVRERTPSVLTTFCFGDGSGTPCPCGNNATIFAEAGCRNSLGTGGLLIPSGASSISSDTLVLHANGMPNSSALYFQGSTQANGGLGAVFGDGLRCAAGTIVRLGTKTNAGGGSQYPGAGDPSVSAKGLVTSPGTRRYQVWYRNAATFCNSQTFNLSNGAQVTWLS